MASFAPSLLLFFAAALLGARAALSGEVPSVPGLQLHLDASDEGALTLSAEEEVLEWRNSAEAGMVFTPVGSSIQLVADAVNGRPAVRFDGASFLETESPAAMGMTNDIGGFTAIAVGTSTGVGSQNYFRIGRGEGGSAAGLRVMLGWFQGSEHRFLARRVDDGGFQTVSGSGRAIDEWGIDAGIVDFVNAEGFLFLNGTEVASSGNFLDPGNTSPTDSQMFRIGNDHGSQYWDGDIAEILMFDRVLSAVERREVELYLAGKYDLYYPVIEPEPVALDIERSLGIAFETEEGRSYQVFHSADGAEWTELHPEMIPGSGAVETVHFPSVFHAGEIRVTERTTFEHQPNGEAAPDVSEWEGLRLWLDASAAGSVVLDGESVQEWHSAAGEAMVFNSPEPGNRPTHHAGEVNGRSVVRFGTGRFLQTSSPAALGMTNDISGATVFAVGWNSGSGSQNYFRVGRGDGGSPAGLRIMLGRQSDRHRLLARRVDDGPFDTVAGGERLEEEWGIDSGYVDFANVNGALYINGVEVASSETFLNPGNTSPTDSQMFRIGTDHADQFWQGDIAEILIFDRVLAREERNEAGIYLSDKYGIPYTYTEERDIPFETVRGVGLEVSTGFENRYLVETSDDLNVWEVVGSEFTGTGFPAGVFAPYEDKSRAFFRAWRTAERDRDRKHVGVYYRRGDFAAWPANHGIWSWGNEILVGFQAARHEDTSGHSWDPDTSRHKFARSVDGGITWTIEDAYEQGITAEATGHRLGELAEEPEDFSGQIDFTHPDFAFTFRRRTNTAGPSAFYYSYDRGKSWAGPYRFPDLGTEGVATRTDYIVKSEHEMLVFLTTAKDDGQIGWSASARTSDGGNTWEKRSWIDPDPEGQAIMPSSVRLAGSEILTVLRRTGDRSQPGARKWLAAYLSEDDGATWEWLNDPAEGLGWNSNPPSLIELADGRLCLVYAVRGGASSGPESRVCARFSSDRGRSWGEEVVLRDGDGANRDMGYTRAVQRPDGRVVVVYYYNHALDGNRPPYRYIAATIFDPDEFE